MPSDHPRAVPGRVWLDQRWLSIRPHPPPSPGTLAIDIRGLLGDLDGVLHDPIELRIYSDCMGRLAPATSLSMATPFRRSVAVNFVGRILGPSVASSYA